MLSVSSRCSGQVDASDSKREYLCSIVGSCLYLTMGSDLVLYGCRCAVATREKTAVFYSRVVSSFTLHTLLKAIVRCLQLNTGGCRGCNPEGGLLVIDAVGLRSMYIVVMPAYFHSMYSAPTISVESLFVNCPSVICLPSIFIYWEGASSELWTPVLLLLIAIFYSIFLFCSLQTILLPHGSFNPLFSAKPVSLTTSLKVGDKVLGCLCAGLHVAADAGSAPCHELVRNTSGENVFLLLVDKPWFLTEGKLPAVLIIPFSWGSTQRCA